MTTAEADNIRRTIRSEARDIERAEPGVEVCPGDATAYRDKAINVLDMIDELAAAGRPTESVRRAEGIACDYLTTKGA